MNLYLIRGLPGAGKTTTATSFCDVVFSADDYFVTRSGKYKFDKAKIGDAHENCERRTAKAMRLKTSRIGVANTFTQYWEMAVYFELAKKYGYQMHVLTVDNWHGSESVHDVPQYTINQMCRRFESKLSPSASRDER